MKKNEVVVNPKVESEYIEYMSLTSERPWDPQRRRDLAAVGFASIVQMLENASPAIIGRWKRTPKHHNIAQVQIHEGIWIEVLIDQPAEWQFWKRSQLTVTRISSSFS